MPRVVGRPRLRNPAVQSNRAGGVRTYGRARTSARRGEGGFSLTESLAAILLATLVILGLAAGILTTVRATRVVSQTQKAEAALSDATESVKAAPFVTCAEETTYVPAKGTVTAVWHLQSGTEGEVFQDACGPSNADVAQRITIRVDGRSADVVKRNPAASTVTP